MEDVLDDFGQDVADGVTDLLVDAELDILLGVRNVVVDRIRVAAILENAAVAGVVQVKQVLGADRVAIAGVDWVLAFD